MAGQCCFRRTLWSFVVGHWQDASKKLPDVAQNLQVFQQVL